MDGRQEKRMADSADERPDGPGAGGEPDSMARLDRLTRRAGADTEAAPTGSQPPRSGLLSGLGWAAAGAGVVAGSIALLPSLRDAGDAAGAVAADPADPAVQAPAAAPASELADRIAALEAELAEARATPPPPAPRPSPADSGPLLQRLEALEAETRRLSDADAALQSRIEGLAGDMASAGITTGAVAAATAEARTLFAVLAARRFVDRGRPLGAFEPLLVQQFETREPSAVTALTAWSRAPVSRGLLAETLARIGTAGAETALSVEAPGFWKRLWQSLSGVVSVERTDRFDSTQTERAAELLAGGDLAGAIALVSGLPEELPGRGAWLEDARRLQAAEEGLDRLEFIAVQSAQAAG
jgi:hypothetical protein